MTSKSLTLISIISWAQVFQALLATVQLYASKILTFYECLGITNNLWASSEVAITAELIELSLNVITMQDCAKVCLCCHPPHQFL